MCPSPSFCLILLNDRKESWSVLSEEKRECKRRRIKERMGGGQLSSVAGGTALSDGEKWRLFSPRTLFWLQISFHIASN